MLLTRQNYAIKQYIDHAHAWADVLQRAGGTLDGLVPPAAGQSRAESGEPEPYPTPIARPGDLYSRARTAREAQDEILAVKRQVEQTAVPETMVGLHGLVINAVDAALSLGQATLDLVGAPDGGPAAQQAAAKAAESLAGLQEALAQQEALLERDGQAGAEGR